MYDDLRDALLAQDFMELDPSGRQEFCAAAGMAANGEYLILLDMYRKDVSVFIEQTSVATSEGSLTSLAKYPPVCVVERGDSRVACDPDSLDLVLSLIAE